jgi:hypothetical protein
LLHRRHLLRSQPPPEARTREIAPDKQQNIRALRHGRSALQLVKKVRSDFSDKLPAKSQNKKQYFVLRFWPLRRVIEREREP